MIRQTPPNYQDRVLVCCDCGQRFTFTAGEQRFYASKGLSDRLRCAPCCDQRRLSIKPKGAHNG
jgi:hypothetical protein